MTDRRCEALRTYARDTAVDPAAEARVRGRLRGLAADRTTDASRPDGGESRVLLRFLPAGEPTAERRIRDRVHRTLEERAHRSFLRPALAAAALGAVAAAVIVAIGWALAPEDDRDLAVALVPAATAVDLDGVAGVRARIEGTGTLGGTVRRPVIAWHEGSIELEVEPEDGPDLVVTTADGLVRVTGTVFKVERDLLGTRVSVSEGLVEVSCSGGEAHRLGPGERYECLPATPAGLLARARAQATAGAAPDEVLATVGRGLDGAPEGPIGVELRFLRIEQLVQASRLHDALAEADAFLAAGSPLRRADVARIAARAALVEEGCDRALPFLQVLEAERAATADDLAALDRCRRSRPR